MRLPKRAILSNTPRLIVMLGKMHGVCCVMCGHYEPTVKAWNRARRGQACKKNKQNPTPKPENSSSIFQSLTIKFENWRTNLCFRREE